MSITADTRIDVNAAFHAERGEQVGRIQDLMSDAGQARYIAEQTANFDARVAKGELVKLGDGRYQSTGGWDRGEIWTVRSINGQSLVIPDHQLDITENGEARLYSAVPAWHGLGQIIPAGISDVAQVIELGHLDVPAVSVPVPDYSVPGLAGKFSAPGQFIVTNGNTGEFWGMVGKVHKNIPILASFEFIQKLIDDQEVIWESAGLMGGGRKVFISCKVPGGIVIDANGVNDLTDLFLVVQDARDGSGSYKGMITPWRPLCGNTNRFALRDAVSSVSLRHTSGLPDRIEQARVALGATLKYREEFAAEETALARTDTTTGKFEALMAEIFALGSDTPSGQVFGGRMTDEESTRTRLANDRREEDLHARFGTEVGRVGRTLYAAEQAFTGYLDWGKVRKGTDAAAKWQARIEASLAGDDDLTKTRAHAKLLTLTTR
jgi:phage/plasmid-like protein (TIGR03299 family)